MLKWKSITNDSILIGNAVVGYVLESHFLLGFSYADFECCIYVETKKTVS